MWQQPVWSSETIAVVKIDSGTNVVYLKINDWVLPKVQMPFSHSDDAKVTLSRTEPNNDCFFPFCLPCEKVQLKDQSCSNLDVKDYKHSTAFYGPVVRKKNSKFCETKALLDTLTCYCWSPIYLSLPHWPIFQRCPWFSITLLQCCCFKMDSRVWCQLLPVPVLVWYRFLILATLCKNKGLM